MDNNVSSASENLIERKLRGAQNASEMEKGEKKVLAIGCADSRYVGTWLMNDSATAVACDVGGTMEGEEPGQEDQLNDQAKALLDRAIKEGIDVVAYFPHGLCGCVNNACACAHPDPHASSHAHGEEAHILSKMGARKKWAVDRVEKAGSPEAYLEEKNFKVPEGMSKAALLAFAVEIEHGLHQAKLIKDYMESKGSTAKVVVPYYDIKTNDTYLYIQEQGKFFKVTGDDAQKVPAEYAELAKTLKEGTAKMQDAWEKGGLKFTQKPQVLGVGHTFADVSVETLLDGKPGEVFTLLNETGLRDLKDPKKLSLQAIEALTYGAHIDVKDVVIYPQGRSPQAKAEYAGDPATYLKSMGLPATGANVYSRANEIAIGLKEKALTEAHLKLLNPDSKIRVSVEYFDAAKGALYSFDASKNRFVPSFKSEPGRPGARPKGPGADLK